MQRGFLLDVVIRKGSSIFKLLSGKDQSLLLWRDSFFVLDFRLHVLDGVVWLDVEGDRFTGQGLDEDLHGTTTKTKDEMQRRFLLDVVIRKGSPIFKLLSGENEPLLLWRDAFLVLDFRLHV